VKLRIRGGCAIEAGGEVCVGHQDLPSENCENAAVVRTRKEPNDGHEDPG
jgi:hypothetical protein